jgi:hypothetical protein
VRFFKLEREAFTEEEAINITIQHGYDGSEFKTAVWKDRGCLIPNRTMDALISKLETIYKYVEVKGKGKKRNYFLSDKKEEMTERVYNYKGTVPTEEDITMKEYIFNYLILNRIEIPHSYKKWGEMLGLLQLNNSWFELFTNEIIKLHRGLIKFNPNEIASEFISSINNNNKAVVRNSFNRLEKDGRISQSSVYMFKTIYGNHEEVDEEDYDNAMSFKRDLVDSLGINFQHYTLSYYSFYKNDKMQRIIREVNEQMAKEFKIAKMYKEIKISIKDNKIEKEISKEEFNQAYFQKFIKLTRDRQNRDDYQNSKSFWRTFYLMNTLTLLALVLKDRLEVEGLEELLYEEKKRRSDGVFLNYVGELVEEFEF